MPAEAHDTPRVATGFPSWYTRGVRRFWWLLLGLVVGPPAVLALVVWSATRLPAPLVVPEPGGLLPDVTLVIPGVGRAEGRSVAIDGDRITAIAPAVPGAVKFKGAFAFPGLIDGHVHFPDLALTDEVPLHAFLYLRHGVTTVRNLADAHGNASTRAKDGVQAGAFPGPRVLRCGPFVDGEGSIWPNSIRVTTAAGAEAAVEQIVADGFDCVKAYDELKPDVLTALVRAAGRAQIPLVGHVPRRAAWESAGLDDAQHLRGVPPAAADGSLPGPPPDWWRAFASMTPTEVAVRAGEALWQDMAVTPTLAAQSQLLVARDVEAFRARPELALLPPYVSRALWDPTTGISAIRRVPVNDRDWMDRAFSRMKFVARRFFESGVKLRTGTDSGAPGIVPGAALHEELHLLVAAGLSPEQALSASMVTTAQGMDIPNLGSLAPGAPADLVLFERDPTEDLANLGTIVAVVAQGRIYTREMLEAQESSYRESYVGFGASEMVPALARFALSFLDIERSEQGPPD